MTVKTKVKTDEVEIVAMMIELRKDCFSYIYISHAANIQVSKINPCFPLKQRKKFLHCFCFFFFV